MRRRRLIAVSGPPGLRCSAPLAARWPRRFEGSSAFDPARAGLAPTRRLLLPCGRRGLARRAAGLSIWSWLLRYPGEALKTSARHVAWHPSVCGGACLTSSLLRCLLKFLRVLLKPARVSGAGPAVVRAISAVRARSSQTGRLSGAVIPARVVLPAVYRAAAPGGLPPGGATA